MPASHERQAPPGTASRCTSWLTHPAYALPTVRAYACLAIAPEDAPFAALGSIGPSKGLFIGGTGDSFAPAFWQRLVFLRFAGLHTPLLLNGGTHCFLDLSQAESYPLSQCGPANRLGNVLMDQADQLWLVEHLSAPSLSRCSSRTP